MNSFLPAKLNLPVWRGATFRYQFQWLDDNGKERTPHDLTGYTGEAKLVGDDGSELILSTGNGGIIFGEKTLKEPKNGIVEIYMTEVETEAITWQKATYTLYVVEPNTPKDKLPLLAGQFTVVKMPL